MKANNIILFPNSTNIISFPKTKAEIDQNLDATKQYHIQEAINLLIPHVFNHLRLAGFEPEEENEFSVKEGAFIVEAIRSHMYSHYGLKHPFQKIVEKIFVPDEEDEGSLKITKTLKVNLE